MTARTNAAENLLPQMAICKIREYPSEFADGFTNCSLVTMTDFGWTNGKLPHVLATSVEAGGIAGPCVYCLMVMAPVRTLDFFRKEISFTRYIF
jgi:hypothetical protein